VKRILFVITDLSTGGAETVLCRLLSLLDRDIYEPAVVALGEGGPVAENITRLGIPVIAARRSMQSLHRETLRFRPDLLQGWMYHGNIAAWLEAYLRSNPKIPLVWNIRHSLHDVGREKWMTRFWIRSGAWLSNHPVRIIYNSRISAFQHERFGYNKLKTLVIPNGFDCDQFKPNPEARADVRKELGIGPDEIILGHFARFHPTKGHEIFLNACAKLVSKSVSVHLLMVGKGVTANNRTLMQQIEKYELTNRCHLLGERHDIPRLTATLDVAVSSSYGEAFPNTIGEAMAAGVPCVCTDVGDAYALMGQTGRLVEPGNATALAAAIHELIQMGSESRAAMGTEARRRIQNDFSLQKIVSTYQNLYQQLTENLNHP
jgi:glycosyltransferase involved in cell wall biosynthesis